MGCQKVKPRMTLDELREFLKNTPTGNETLKALSEALNVPGFHRHKLSKLRTTSMNKPLKEISQEDLLKVFCNKKEGQEGQGQHPGEKFHTGFCKFLDETGGFQKQDWGPVTMKVVYDSPIMLFSVSSHIPISILNRDDEKNKFIDGRELLKKIKELEP